jgi:NAD(P)-dependent dehydrogenase (short-subunit alcohol dehydrogenase family)
MELDGKTALVTGAGSNGIGRAVVLALAQAGAGVAIHYLDQKAAALDLRDAVRKTGQSAHAFSADLADPQEARKMVHAADAALGGIDIVVSCAATLARVPFLEITDDEWDRVHQVNLRGTFAVAQEAARSMSARGCSGRIILVSSVNQDHPTMHLAHYVASKGGVRMLARSMALELAPLGITVNLLAPGTVETDLNRKALANSAFRADKLSLIPMNRIAEPSEIAAAAVFLASSAASYITGETITIDGGLTL